MWIMSTELADPGTEVVWHKGVERAALRRICRFFLDQMGFEWMPPNAEQRKKSKDVVLIGRYCEVKEPYKKKVWNSIKLILSHKQLFPLVLSTATDKHSLPTLHSHTHCLATSSWERCSNKSREMITLAFKFAVTTIQYNLTIYCSRAGNS